MPHQRLADGSAAGDKTQRIDRNPGRVHQANRFIGDQGRFFRRLRDHGIAGHQRRGDLSRKDGQREIPGADAHEYAAPVQAQSIRLAGGSRKPPRLGKQPHRFGGVVTAKVHRFANLGNCIRQCLAGFLDQDRDQPVAFVLELVGHRLQQPGPRLAARGVPIRLGARRLFERAPDFRLIGIGTIAQAFSVVRRIEYGPSGAAAGVAEEDGRSPQGRTQRPYAALLQPAGVAGIGEIEPGRIRTGRAEQRPRVRDAGMRGRGGSAHRADRIGRDTLGRELLVQNAIDEGGIGAIFQQAPNQVGEQILVGTHRSIDAQRRKILVLPRRRTIERCAHAVQALELEIARLPGKPHHGGDGVRIVGCKLARDLRRMRQHPSGADQVRKVGSRLAGKDREIRIAHDLRVLDLRVPVRALHQPHRYAAPDPASQRHRPVDHPQRPLAVGLYDDPQAGAGGGMHGLRNVLEEIQREIEAVGLLGVDGEPDPDLRRAPGQRAQPRPEFRQNAFALGKLIAWVERRQLDRHRRRLGCSVPRRLPQRFDRMHVGAKITPGGGAVARGLAEHVVGVALALAASLQGFLDGPAQHELRAENPHRLANRPLDHRLAEPVRKLAQPCRRVGGEFAVHGYDPPGEDQRPGGGIHQHVVGVPQVRGPLTQADLVRDQPVRGFAVGNAQERLGQAHEGDPFPIAQAVLRQESIQDRPVRPVLAHGHDDRRGGFPDRPGMFVAVRPGIEQRFDRVQLGSELGAANGRAQSLETRYRPFRFTAAIRETRHLT